MSEIDDNGKRPSVLKGAGQLGLARLITISTRVLYIVLAARFLGSEIYGIFSVAQAWSLAFLPLTTLGLGAHIVYQLNNDKGPPGVLLNQVLTLVLITTVLSATASLLIGTILETDPTAQWLIVLFSLALVGRGINRFAEFVFIGFERPVYTLRQDAAFRILEVGSVTTALLSGAGVLVIAGLSAAVWWLQAASALFLIRRRLLKQALRFDTSNLRALLVVAVPLVTMAFFAEAILQYPIVIIRHLIDDAAVVGNVALTLQALFVVAVVPWSLAQAALPAVVRAASRGERRERRFLDVILRVAVLGATALAIGADWIGRPLVQMLLGHDYTLAGELLWMSMLIFAPLSILVGVRIVLNAHRRYRYTALSVAIAFATLLAGAFLLVPKMGPPGLYVAAFFSHLAGAAFGLVPIIRNEFIVVGRQTRNGFLLAGLAGASYIGLVGTGFSEIGGALSLALLGLGSLRWCLTRDERLRLIAPLVRR